MSSNTIKFKVKEAKTWLDKISGLIGKKEPEALLIRTRFGIHTFGMKFPIDVLVLDYKNYIVRKKENLRPNSFLFWNPHFNQVLELPLFTISKLNLKKGMKVDLEIS